MTRQLLVFWTVTGLLLIWNGMGCLNYIFQTNPANVADMPENYQSVINARPGWATAGFALHVFAGAIGCLLLFARRAMAQHAFVLSLIAGLVFFVFILILFLNGGVNSSVFLGPLLSVLVALFSIGFTKRSITKGIVS